MEEIKKEDTPQETPLSAYEKLEVMAARVEAANKKSEELLAQQAQIATRLLMGGKSEAGKPAEQPAEITNKEYAKMIMTGKLK